MSDNKIYLTAEGREQLERELQNLKEIQRLQIAQKLKEAVAEGDLKENANYHDAKERQGFIEGKIQDIEAKLRHAVIIERDESSDIVQIGHTVTIREDGTKDDETYTIVGAAEANPTEGKISNESPIGKALLGGKKGQKVLVTTPGGKIKFKIRKIE